MVKSVRVGFANFSASLATLPPPSPPVITHKLIGNFEGGGGAQGPVSQNCTSNP